MTPTSDHRWTNRHGEAVRHAAPTVPAFTADEQLALWQRIEDTAPVPAAGLTRRWRTAVAAVVAVGAVGFAGTAAAEIFTAHTGNGPADTEDVVIGGPGERLNPQAPDFASVLAEETIDIRFPSARSRDRALAWEVEDLSDEVDSLVSVGALRLWVAGHAVCSWSNAWAEALRTGDAAMQERATEVILGARTWPAIADTDTRLDEEAAWLPVLERAVRSSDLAAAKTALGSNQTCMPGLAPELGLGKRW